MTEQIVSLGTVFTGSSSGRVVKRQGGQRKVGPRSVVIKITHSGLCGSDLHFLTNESMTLGHEPVGVVSQVGPAVKKLKVGDRVGYGCIHDACLDCESCIAGQDQNCRSKKAFGTHDFDQGGFGDTVVMEEPFVHKIPDGMSMETASVLQCAGATVMGAIINAGVHPFDRVGVWSIGGLGHIALGFLKGMGCQVVAFSTTSAKREEAMRLGAHEFVATTEKTGRIQPVDKMLICTSVAPDWSKILRYLKFRGVAVPLSLDYGDLVAPYMPLLGKEIRIMGSMVAGRGVHQNMLNFAQRHVLEPMIEVLPMTEDGINKAIERMKKGDVRYRFVLVNQNNQHLLKEKSKM